VTFADKQKPDQTAGMIDGHIDDVGIEKCGTYVVNLQREVPECCSLRDLGDPQW